MRAHRKWVDVEITDLVAFEARWWAWWRALQPPERANSRASSVFNIMPVPRDGMDWECLKKAGVNRLLLVVIALRWWGKASGADEGWRAAANDFQLALFCITRAASTESPMNPSAAPRDADVGNAPSGPKSLPAPQSEAQGVSTRHNTLQASGKANAAAAQPTKKRVAAGHTGEESGAKKARLTRRR